MKVFLTGATGFIGSRIIPELLAAGHQVLGLTRSDEGAKALEAAGAQVHRGTLEDPETLKRGAEQAEAVIHCAFDHDFSNFVANCEKDKRAIEAMGSVLVGSNRPFLITSGVGVGSGAPGEPALEKNPPNLKHPNPRISTELTGVALAEKGVNVVAIRLPQVHDTFKQGLITPLIEMAREKGVSAYIGDGQNCWSACHVSDVALLYRLALEKPSARYNAVDEMGVPLKDIAEVIGRGLGIPVEARTPEHFGWMAGFVGMDMTASSAWTQKELGWTPKGPSLLTDLAAMSY